MLQPLIPAVAAGLDTTVSLVAGAITAYMIPFASLQLVSGTIGERLGAARVVRTAYVVFGAASLIAAFAPDIWTFIGARALTGAANAFLTPILLAALSETVAPAVLGRTVGTFAAVQVAGLTLAPALGGALGEVSWRLGFVLVAAVAFALAFTKLEVRGRAPGQPRPRLRSLFKGRLVLVSAKAATGYLGFTAIGFLVTLVCVDVFGLGSGLTGLVVAAYGIGGMVFGRYAGVVVDRAGRPRTALLGVTACGLGVLALAFVPGPWSFALVYFAVGCGSAFAWAGLNTIVVERFPDNRAGSVSVYSAFKFVGVAIAPLVYVPLYDSDASLPFLVAAGFSGICALLVLPWFRTYARGPAPPSAPAVTAGEL
jgi:MFS family permease